MQLIIYQTVVKPLVLAMLTLLMRFEAAYDAFGSLKLEITDIDSANAHLLPLNLIVDQDEKSLASWMEGRTIPKNRAFVEQILSTAGLTRNDILGILDVSKGLSINDSYWLDDGKSDVTFDEINLFDNRFDEVLGLVAYTCFEQQQPIVNPSNCFRKLPSQCPLT